MPALLVVIRASNFRDIGGLKAKDGRLIRFGQLFRSQSLHALTDADVEGLRMLGIRLVFDLRSRRERTSRPSRWPDGTNTLHLELDLAADIRARNRALLDILRASPSAHSARQMMLASYHSFPTTFAEPLKRLLSYMLSDGGREYLPMLVHCSAGKDRTGFVIAMILSALDVSREDIIQDYMRMEDCVEPKCLVENTEHALEALLGFVPDEQTVAIIAGRSPDYIQAAFTSIESLYSSVDNYLTHACGLTRPARERLCVSILA